MTKGKPPRPDRRRVPWGDLAIVVDEVADYWVQACIGHPDLMPEMEGASGWLGQQVGDYQGDRVLDHLTGLRRWADHWLRKRYPRIALYPPYLPPDPVYAALQAVLWGEMDTVKAGSALLQRVTKRLRELGAPVVDEMWWGTRVVRGASTSEPSHSPPELLDDLTGALALNLDWMVYRDRVPLDLNDGGLWLLRRYNPGWTDEDVRHAQAAELAMLRDLPELPGHAPAAEGGHPVAWRHLPALYRLWCLHPTSRTRPDLRPGAKRVTWETFAQTALNVTEGDADRAFWVKARPTGWTADKTDVSTVRRATLEAIRWLAPEVGTPPHPARHWTPEAPRR